MAESRFIGPTESVLGFESKNEGVGVYRTFGATLITASATFITKFKAIQGAMVFRRETTAPAATDPVFFSVTYTNATLIVRANTAALGVPATAATCDVYIKGTFG